MRLKTSGIGLALLLSSVTAAPAQWLNLRDDSIPRTKDGKPDLHAPAPRRADGKPDLSGVWLADGRKHLIDLAGKPNGAPMLPWAAAITKERSTGVDAAKEPDANCLPPGVPKINTVPNPFKIVQNPDEVIILYEALDLYRQIFMDGRGLPDDPNPTWMGYSVGRYERNSLVVETAGFNGKTWLDTSGHPTTEALHVIERFRRPDFGHLKIDVTIDDPKAYSKPWTVTESMHYLPDTDLLEFICNENNRDVPHLLTLDKHGSAK